MRSGKEELICDLAETYAIYDIRTVRPSTLATLAVGLRDSSRIKMKLAGASIDLQTRLLAIIADELGILIWQRTENGRKGKNRPKSILEELEKDHSDDVKGFDTAEEFRSEIERFFK